MVCLPLWCVFIGDEGAIIYDAVCWLEWEYVYHCRVCGCLLGMRGYMYDGGLGVGWNEGMHTIMVCAGTCCAIVVSVNWNIIYVLIGLGMCECLY